jgi:ABC-type Mn2+/Zn2+ transport system permease subunit
LTPFVDALLLQAGYNAALVAIGAGLLGFASGATGTFLLLRKRALVSDAIAHATLPGVGVAFILMVALGGDGRNLAGLLLGSAISAAVGLLLIQWIVARTRLTEDAAIGAVLGAFFGFGIVLLTVIQSMSSGRQAGLEGFLLGSTAGMLRQDAIVILAGGLLALGLIWGLRRPMTLVSFDAEFATAAGYKVSRIDLMMMASVLVVTVIGLKVVGLVLIVALLIIPPVAARFWTDQVGPHDLDFQRHRRRFGLCRRGGLGLRAGPSDRTDHRPRRGGHLRCVAALRAGARACGRGAAAAALQGAGAPAAGPAGARPAGADPRGLYPAPVAARKPCPRRWRADGRRARGGGQGLAR